MNGTRNRVFEMSNFINFPMHRKRKFSQNTEDLVQDYEVRQQEINVRTISSTSTNLTLILYVEYYDRAEISV